MRDQPTALVWRHFLNGLRPASVADEDTTDFWFLASGRSQLAEGIRGQDLIAAAIAATNLLFTRRSSV
jgi:hypothetical protein